VEGIPCGVFLDFWAQPESIGQEAMKSIHEDPQRGSFPYTFMNGLDSQWNKQLTK
jgi:hypothetical protein